MLRSPVESAQERDCIVGLIESLPKRGEPERALVRVVALLRQYFTTDTAQSVIEVEAEDWADALGGFPDWAVRNACRWWQGADNPNRRKKPLIGDIVEICRNEAALLSLARDRVRQFDRAAIAPPEREVRPDRVTPERAAEIMREVFGDERAAEMAGAPKRFPQVGEGVA